MTWIWIIIGFVVGVFIINLFRGDSLEESAQTALVAGTGCAAILFQIFLAVAAIWILIWLGNWLFS